MPTPRVHIVLQKFKDIAAGCRIPEIVAVFETDEQAQKYITSEVAEYTAQGVHTVPEDFIVEDWEVHR